VSIAPGFFSFPPDPATRARALSIYDAIGIVRLRNQDGALRFWYNSADPLGPLFTAISSACGLWHWRLVSEDFPEHTDPLTHRDTQIDSRTIINPGETAVILSSQGDDVLRRVADSLRRIGLRADVRGYAKILRGAVAFQLTFVEFRPSDLMSVVDLSLANIAAAGPPATVTPRSGGVIVRTPTAPWSYAATLSIPLALLRAHADSGAMMQIRLRVHRGRIGVGVLNTSRTDWIAQREVLASPTPMDIGLTVPRLGDTSGIVIYNWEPGGEGLVEVESVNIGIRSSSRLLKK